MTWWLRARPEESANAPVIRLLAVCRGTHGSFLGDKRMRGISARLSASGGARI